MALHDLRTARGLTQRQLSLSSGIPQDVISSIETGRVRNPTWRTVRRLSLALGVRPETAFPDHDEHAQAS
jgi:transcriptional regulator with XRE-family HTH domain